MEDRGFEWLEGVPAFSIPFADFALFSYEAEPILKKE